MPAVTTPDPAAPPSPVKMVTAFPFPSVVAHKTDREPLVAVNVTVTPLAAVPRLFLTLAVKTMFEVLDTKVEIAGLRVILKADVADPVLVITAVLDMLPTAAWTVSDRLSVGLVFPD
jgi:hypothetical protein